MYTFIQFWNPGIVLYGSTSHLCNQFISIMPSRELPLSTYIFNLDLKSFKFITNVDYPGCIQIVSREVFDIMD